MLISWDIQLMISFLGWVSSASACALLLAGWCMPERLARWLTVRSVDLSMQEIWKLLYKVEMSSDGTEGAIILHDWLNACICYVRCNADCQCPLLLCSSGICGSPDGTCGSYHVVDVTIDENEMKFTGIRSRWCCNLCSGFRTLEFEHGVLLRTSLPCAIESVLAVF